MEYRKLIEEALKKVHEEKYEEAIEIYDKAFEEQIELNDYATYAICQHAVKNYEKVETILFEILEYSDTSQVNQMIAINYSSMGNFVEAIEYFKKAIELDPENTDARLSLSGLYEEFTEEELAKDEYDKILEYEPDNFWANLNLGSYYEKSNQLNLSYNYLSKAYQINPDEKMINYNLGVYYSKVKEFDKAKFFYQEEIKNPECHPYAYLNLALLYKDVYKDKDKSRKTYLEGIDRYNEIGELWYNLGCLYVVDKDYETGASYIKRSFEIDQTLIEFSKTDVELEEFRTTKNYKDII